MKFIIDSCENLEITDEEISELLSLVYVQAGFTTAESAKKIFDPIAVRNRGVIFASREASKNEFSGMVIVVPPASSAIVRAMGNECEIHLLGVKPQFRGHGLGYNLAVKAIDFVEQNNWSKIVLWTQKPMKKAQKLYESLGFIRSGEMTKSGIEFLVYEK